jgi:hypothetical protein
MPLSSHSTSKISVPIWIPHWPACMRALSREEVAWRRAARGRKRPGSSQVKLILSPKQRAKPKTSARKTGSSMPHCVARWALTLGRKRPGRSGETQEVLVVWHGKQEIQVARARVSRAGKLSGFSTPTSRAPAESYLWFAAFVVNSEPHDGARPSVRLCVGLTNVCYIADSRTHHAQETKKYIWPWG